MNKQIIIDYEEYLELVKFKEMVEEAKKSPDYCFDYSSSEKHCTKNISGCNKLFDYLVIRDDVVAIKLQR